jgi:hypothetical protein
LPHQARSLSNRLVTQNGIMLMGVAAVAILVLTRGEVGLLVVLYSMTVFGAFALTLLGMCVYWVKHRSDGEWLGRLLLSLVGFLICAGILAMISIDRFGEGGWITLVIVAVLVGGFYRIRRHYQETRTRLERADRVFARKVTEPKGPPPPLEPSAPTAIFLVGGSVGTGMHSLLWVRRLFPDQFHNFIFVRTGEVDTASFGGEARLEEMSREVDETLHYFIAYCQNHKLAAEGYKGFGTDTVAELVKLVEAIVAKYPNAIVFASKLIFEDDAWWTRILHNQTALTMQRQLHLRGLQMVILPMIVHAQKGERQERQVRRSFHWVRPAKKEKEREVIAVDRGKEPGGWR